MDRRKDKLSWQAAHCLILTALCCMANQVLGQGSEQLSVVGSRVTGRTADEAAVAIEVYDDELILKTGISETGKLLQALTGTFNFSATTVSDGSDIVRPASLKGMAPDQVLVLINGKRRHSQALLNVQQTVGRGSAGTDINAIPVAAIKRVEILRQGASAQYGSDAIAGVINIVLKDASSGHEVFTYGAKNYAGDGTTLRTGVSSTVKTTEDSFIQVSGEIQNRGETNRANPDPKYGRQTLRIGEAESKDGGVFFNAESRLNDATQVYAFGGASQRRGESGGFFREPDGDRNFASVYPDGFLPLLVTKVEDRSLLFGVKRELADGELDVSYGIGQNSFNFASKNSLNISLGPDSPRDSDDGTLKYSDSNFNADFRRSFELWSQRKLDLSVGFVLRRERYQILAGDSASWTYGPNNDFSIPITGQNGAPAAAGMQGFPGFQPANEVDASRNSRGVFIDLETKPLDQLLTALALRTESYEGVGDATTGQFSLRYDFHPAFAVRASVSTGFRAPSLQQANYSSRSTTFAGQTLTETQTVRQGSEAFRAIGLSDLANEKSVNQSLGFTSHPLPRLSISTDIYRIRIKDRIVLSEFLQSEAKDGCAADLSNCPIRKVLEPIKVDAAQFFTNAIDTDTKGLDFLIDYSWRLAEAQNLNLKAAYYWNQTQVKDIRAPNGIDPHLLFSEAQVVLTEEAQPRTRYQVATDYNLGSWASGIQANYYGAVAGAGFGGYKQTYSGKWLTDIHSGYAFPQGLRFDLGALNVFNVYPDEMDAQHPVRAYAGGSFKYSWETAPFGYKGGIYYSRLAYSF